MKNKFPVILFLVITSLTLTFPQQKFHVNLNDRADDLFKVTVYPNNLSGKNNVYHFAATAPGMYQLIDAGRFVRSFKAFDKNGNEIKTNQESTNDWDLSQPEKINKIEYSIAETWHTPVDKEYIYEMGGTTLEKDNAVINGPDVFGYFEGKQADPVYVKLDYPADWLVGTALKKDKDGYYEADNYDHIVDSPFMLGKLSTTSISLDNSVIDIFTYSKTDMIKSQNIMESAKDIFHALKDFVKKLPVDRYVLLFHFEDKTIGALEHSYSSFYVYKEEPLNGPLETNLRDVIAHEIFHMVTPLNIHSEIIEQFNFVHPVLSQHLWLYEGVTEWASNIMQLRDSLITLEEHLNTIRKKLLYNDVTDKTISLKELALKSFERQPDFIIIYQRGAVTAELLDILLLEQSKGKRGLREVILELSKDYGKNKAFSENGFFDEFVKRTYPQVKDFIDNYIVNANPLPVKEYFDKIGINYQESEGFDSTKISLGLGLGIEGNYAMVAKAPENSEAKPGDVILKINNDDANIANFQKIYTAVMHMKVGEKVTFTAKRDGKEIEYNMELKPQEIKHIFEVIPNATPEQLALREAWMRNL